MEDDLSCQPCSRRVLPYIDKVSVVEYDCDSMRAGRIAMLNGASNWPIVT